MQITKATPAHGSSSATLAVHSPCAPLAEAFAAASRARLTPPGYVPFPSPPTPDLTCTLTMLHIRYAQARHPVSGGNFGVWGCMLSSFDSAIKGYRQNEDAWNAIPAGSLTGGCLALRSGPKSALGSAVA
ncbi:hypothetical protein FIBSPDRAFT_876983, partial [Athelia psychrophila]